MFKTKKQDVNYNACNQWHCGCLRTTWMNTTLVQDDESESAKLVCCPSLVERLGHMTIFKDKYLPRARHVCSFAIIDIVRRSHGRSLRRGLRRNQSKHPVACSSCS
jgi:hypothetical protein